MTTLRLEHFRRPEPMNAHRTLHHHARARVDKSWRDEVAYLAIAARPRARFARAAITVEQTCRAGTTLPDVGACYPAAKAAIDGLVDAGVIPNDTPEHLVSLTFTAPAHGERDSLVLIVEELS